MICKTFFRAGLLTIAAVMLSPAQAAGSNLLVNSAFTPSTTAPKAGYLPVASSWSGSGQKNVGTDPAGGLWLGVTTPVFSGNVNRLGWDVAPNASQSVKVPAGCKAPKLAYQVEFTGAAPQSGSGLKISVGTQSTTINWSATPVAGSFALKALPAGPVAVDLASVKGTKQITGVRAGILVKSVELTCN
ncbi:MAG: hypothetical protein AB3X44_06925 [Leptothrix sp. (in: b-proteobacteria)]